jgi:hypothetical protein
MSLTTKVGLLSGATAFILTGAAFGATPIDSSSNDMQARLAAAEAKIAELSSQQDADWLTEQRSEEIREIVQDVLADADTRASLQGSGMSAGYDNGFVISSSDGKWKLRVNGLLQNRWVMTHNKTPNTPLNGAALSNAIATGGLVAGPNGGFPFNYGNQTNNGFETTRAAINLSGDIAGDYYFNMRLDWSPYNATNNTADQLAGAGVAAGAVAAATPNTGISDNVLEWAYGGIRDAMGTGMDIEIGRQKYDVMRGFTVNAEYQQAIERSLYTYFWGTSNITNGIKVKWANDNFRMNAMYSNAGQDFGNGANQAYFTNAANWAFSGRAEMLMAGTWDQFNQISSTPGEEMGLLLGVGAAYLDSDEDIYPFSNRSDWQVTGDLSLQMGGWDLMGSITYGDSSASTNSNPWGVEVGGGVYLTDDIQMYGRYQWLDPGYGDVYGGSADLNMVTVGANYYLAGNNAKLSVDWSWSFDQVVALGSGYGYTNWLPSGNNGGEWMLRTQLQLMF